MVSRYGRLSTVYKLIFTQHLGAGIFFEAETYKRLQGITKALSEAKTWAEFRTMLPKGIFEELSQWVPNGGNQIYWDGKDHLFTGSQYTANIVNSDVDHVVRFSGTQAEIGVATQR